MRLPLTGGCQCGKIRYAITGEPQLVYACHCTECQRATSSAFSMGLVLTEGAFRLSGAEPRPVQRATESGRTTTRWVCSECGTWVCSGAKPGSATPNTVRVVRAGTLDDTSWLRPTTHYWTRSKQLWITLPEGDRIFETQPTDGGW